LEVAVEAVVLFVEEAVVLEDIDLQLLEKLQVVEHQQSRLQHWLAERFIQLLLELEEHQVLTVLLMKLVLERMEKTLHFLVLLH
jgi:hypothetical protein